LNKITPEKFDRLMEQLLECGIDDAATLSETISIVFDKAIWEPGFCGMYADVCLRLSKELPEFPSGVEGGKPVTFRRILLNTCQEEFEGAGKARDELESIADPNERAAAAKRVKVRTMGNIKLIGELYKKRMIAEKILHACVTDLLGSPSSEPPEENVEALCNLLVTVGKELDASPKLPKQMMEMYFARLAALADETSTLDSRVRFLCRDVIELRKADWVPRVKKLEAMTLSEIHAEAAAALGISPAQTEEILFPEADGWEVVGKNGRSASSNNLAAMGGGKQSSLSGPYVAASHKAAMPTEKEKLKRDAQLREAARERAQAALVGPATPATSSEPAAAATGAMDAEKVEEKTKSLVNEYMQVADLKEAVLCVKEIVAGAKDANALAAMTKHMVAYVVDVSTEKANDLMAKLLAACVKQCGVSADVVFADLENTIEALEDIAIDVPMAPKLLGVMLARLIIEGALEAGTLNAATLKIDEGAVPTRRDFAAAALKELKKNGKVGLAEYVTKSGLDVKAALTGDEKFDGPLNAFLEKNGLKELC
jgi:translation initiation factor 4G